MLLAMFLMASPAWAVTFTSIYDPEPDILLNFGGAGGVLQHDFTHDLTVFPGDATDPNTGATSAAAFNPALFTITSASLSLVLYDGADDLSEAVSVTLDGNLSGPFTVTDDSTKGAPFVLPLAVALSLLSDGKLDVEIIRSQRDFFFDSSTLTLEATPIEPPTNGVPFPSTLILVGAGLIGAAALRARRAGK
jgi:hypothetical protein